MYKYSKNFKSNSPSFLILILFLIVFSLIFVFRNNLYSLLYNKKIDKGEINYSNIQNQNNDNLASIDSKNDFFYKKDTTYIIVMADSHLNVNAFDKIRSLIKKYNVSYVFHLGDHTNFGSDNELEKAKLLLNSLGGNYYVLPGDRDLAAYNGDLEFYKYFNRTDSVTIEGINFLLINNAPNFTLMDDKYLNKILFEIPKASIVLTSQPIYVEKGNILESKYMGSPTAFNFEDPQSKKIQEVYLNQRNKILNEIRKTNNKLIVSGDHHRSATFQDPENDSIKYHILGATAEYLNSNGLEIKQEAFQTQRVTFLSIDKNTNKIEFKEIEIFEE